jgi:2-dehydropantoate 2-reductase
MKIAVVGAGGIGSYFGGRLAAAGTDVHFIARGAQLNALRTKGLRIESPKGHLELPHVNATDDPAAIGPVDVVFFTVKLYDSETAARLLPPLIGQDTIVLSFQNGVEAADTLAAAVGRHHVGGGTTYTPAEIVEPGVVRHTATDHLIFGELDGTSSPRLKQLYDACQPAGFQATLSNQIIVDIWSKFVHLAIYSGMTAIARLPVGPLREDPGTWALWQAGLLEAMAVARAKKIPLPAGLFDTIVSTVQGLPGHARSSMLQDIERGRRLELSWLSGAVVRMGREMKVETQIHRFITTMLMPHAAGSAARVS